MCSDVKDHISALWSVKPKITFNCVLFLCNGWKEKCHTAFAIAVQPRLAEIYYALLIWMDRSMIGAEVQNHIPRVRDLRA